ncbi:hypothetical protein BCV69DRAFT_283880 [Microstroma glucosiphilum]|uniref:Lethal giant larvae (Lgl)-like C-terminal domain-containing protein n=1 Tax=Pseudomicrostroma glucosiphilum TaxID=1684307 RepID=A0A316U392_9BASI|nr:hypothetical protein BCV69DRAFT_283880 [Pseudomicrostroma glucosiphilum]PWN19779.1 hypothetical protein BCV69DRAFT_283880 [Pseudomicrostroma glucosiphilum]
MRRALRDLDSPRSQSPAPGSSSFPGPSSSSALGTPPPRPKRDPNRGGVMRRFRRQGEEEGPPPMPAPQGPAGMENAGQMEDTDAGDEFTDLDEANDWSEDGFKANLLIDLGRGEITQVAHSDIGFLAIACGAGLAIIDLRGPEILLREGLGDDFSVAAPSTKGREGRSAKKLLEAESKAPITSLAWTICRLPGAKPVNHTVLAPRLVVGRGNGLVTVWTSMQALSMWLPERTGAIKVDELDYESSRPSQLSPRCSLQVLDVAGNSAVAVPVELQRAIREQSRSLGREEDALLSDVPLLFGWSDHSLFIRSGLLGPRIAKADTTEAILRAALVERGTEKLAVAVSKTSIRVYSTPGLELVQRIQRHGHDFGEQTTSQQSVSIDRGPSGVFLEVLSSLDARLWTFFAQAPRPMTPSLLLHAPKAMPAHPGAGAVSAVASWFSTKAATTSSLDDVFAGPHRPEAPRLPPMKTKETFVADLAGEDPSPKSPASGSTPLSPSVDGRARGAAARHHATAATVAQTQGTRDQMGWNLDLARRRGEAMAGLENSLASLEKSTSDWVKESKSALIKSAAKDKLSKFGF